MLLSPKRYKFKSIFIRKSLNKQSSIPQLNLGVYGLTATEVGRLSSKQIESARKYLRGGLKKDAKIWVSVFPLGMVTKKPQEVRMGKGKGYLKYWVHFVKKNETLFEAKGNNNLLIKQILSGAKFKLPVQSKLLSKH
uniref:ribosomal protein L16 n=1 Tax=Isochrysis galbana TaxID=37099 RepID=UPI0021B6A6BC|nr:ribosomal protein L16 [Isochrysis galbana]UWI54150.1 ribosomal protein L16 [Isochrysis galbana]